MESRELEIREMEMDDLEHALRLSTQAGWNQNEQDWGRIYYLCDDSCFAGKIDGQLVATGALVPYENKCGWIGMMLVDEKYRRHGYGGRRAGWLCVLGYLALDIAVYMVADSFRLGRPPRQIATFNAAPAPPPGQPPAK